jgi:hypothetical protein
MIHIVEIIFGLMVAIASLAFLAHKIGMPKLNPATNNVKRPFDVY